MNLKKSKVIMIIIISAMFFTVELLFGFTVSAEEVKDKSVYFLNHEGQVNASIFSKDEMLYPGNKIVKEFYIANDNTFKCELKTLGISGELRDKSNNLLKDPQHEYREFMDNVKIHLYTHDRELFKGNAEEFLKADLLKGKPISIEKNGKEEFIMEIEMDMKADMSTMDLEYIFTLTANLFGDEISNGSLVQTGSRIDTGVLLTIGIVILGSGLVIFLFKKKVKM